MYIRTTATSTNEDTGEILTFDNAENYAEILHVLDSITDFSLVLKTPTSSIARYHVTRHALQLELSTSGANLSFLDSPNAILYSLTEDAALLIQIDLSIYMSRFAWLALKFPRINARIAQRALTASGDLQLTVTLDSVVNAGGILNKILPLARLSKFLQDAYGEKRE